MRLALDHVKENPTHNVEYEFDTKTWKEEIRCLRSGNVLDRNNPTKVCFIFTSEDIKDEA